MTHTHDDPYESARNCQACYNPPTNPVRTSYDVRVIGQMWMGGTAAMSYTVAADRVPEFTRCDDESDMDYETRMVQCATETGDFASVDAWEITRHEAWTETVTDVISDPERAPMITTHHERSTPLVEFDEEDADIYNDCVFGMVDDD